MDFIEGSESMGKFFMTVGVILFVVFVLSVIWIIYSRITAKKIMQNGRNKNSFAFSYLSLRFSRLNTMKDVKLIVRNPKAVGGRYVSDIGLVYVNRGGIFVIESVRGSGFVDINEGGKWNRIINDKLYTFDDPFIKNTQRVKDMKTFLRDEGVENIPVHNIVLFTGRTVKFSKHLNGLITANDLTPFMIDLNKDRFLSYKEIRDVVKLIKSKQ